MTLRTLRDAFAAIKADADRQYSGKASTLARWGWDYAEARQALRDELTRLGIVEKVW